MRRLVIAGLSVLLGVTGLGLTACEKAVEPSATSAPITTSTPPLDAHEDTNHLKHSIQVKEIEGLEQFIHSKLTGEQGVYTNLLETDQSGEVASGHELLSESGSLQMLIAVRSGQKKRFEEVWKLTKMTFDMDSGFSYRYSPKQQKLFPVNAAVDDLRIIKALFEAGDRFGEKSFTEEAKRYGQRFSQNNIKNEQIFDFYDDHYKITNKFITLCYIDLSTLRKLSNYNLILDKMYGILENGYLSDNFPFYETRFNYETGKYSSENINTVESLLSILALAQVDKQKSTSIGFIKKQVEAGTLYGQYSREGEPLNDIRSTAIYAITAMIGVEIGDESLYRDSIQRMNEFRVTDKSSPLYGGFGDVASGQAYSFDNLMALLAYVY